MSSRTQRIGVVTGLLAAHSAVIAVFMLGSPSVAVAVPRAIEVSEIRVAAPPLAAIEPKLVALAVTVEPPPLEVEGEAVSKTASPTMTGLSGAGCALSDQVQAALRTSPAVAAALAAMPRSVRSVADATLLWDGRWADAGPMGGTAVAAPIRAAVAGALRTASTECLAAPLAGPRFLYVATADGTRVLALGSGDWSWSQVLDG